MKFLLFLPLVFFASCSTTEPKKDDSKKEEKKEVVVRKRIVGRIASVSSSGTFVLIQKYGTGALPKYDLIQSQGAGGRQASLRPSGERVRDFYAADLLNGSVKIGDAVVAYSDLKKASSEPEPIPEPEPTENGETDEEAIPPENAEAPKKTEISDLPDT